MISIFGAVGYIEDVENFLKKISKFALEKNVAIQVMNADMVYGKNHLISAAEHAIRAVLEKRNSMRFLSNEIMLYAAGERQIGAAISKMGIKRGHSKTAFVFVHSISDIDEANGDISSDEAIDFIGEIGMTLNSDVLYGDESVIKRFGIPDGEIDTIEKDKYEDLILEKVAMVDIIK